MDKRFELYKKYIKGECTPEEAGLVEGWLKEEPEAFEAEMLAELLAMERQKELPLSLKQDMLEHFRQKGIPVEEEVPVVQHTPGKIRWLRWAAATAAVVMGITIGAGLFSRKEHTAEISWIKISNNSKIAKQVLLPDSSQVWLNTLAAISYPSNWDKQAQRDVRLVGEAYFIVKGQAGHGFVVNTGNLQTWVLGTEFNIEAYPEEALVKVSLQQGKIRVNYLNEDGSRSEGKILSPGQMALYRKGGRLVSIARTTVADPSAWRKNGIVLNDVPLGDALQRIAGKYGERIVFDSIAARHYQHITASYRDMGVEQILAQLGFTCEFDYKKDSQTYTISFKPKHGTPPVHN